MEEVITDLLLFKENIVEVFKFIAKSGIFRLSHGVMYLAEGQEVLVYSPEHALELEELGFLPVIDEETPKVVVKAPPAEIILAPVQPIVVTPPKPRITTAADLAPKRPE